MHAIFNECSKRKNPKCLKYYLKNYFEKGKDVEKIFEFQKLKREQKKNKKQNGKRSKKVDLLEKKTEQNNELSKRLDLVEKKTESELRWIFSHPLAYTLECPHVWWITKVS